MRAKEAGSSGLMMVPDDGTEAAFVATALIIPIRPKRIA
jgi:hypothetical protein